MPASILVDDDEIVSVIEPLEELVPLAFVEYPVLASMCDRASEAVDRLVHAVPDYVCEDVDVDLTVMFAELRILAVRCMEMAARR